MDILTISKRCIYKPKGSERMLFDYLKETYAPGEPIFMSDIKIEGITEENLRYHFKKLTDDSRICRFDSGVYYFPKKNMFGEPVSLSADTVAVHKYIMRKGRRIGYYSGYTLANRMGLSSQVPFTEEITSNFAPAQVRELKIKDRRYMIRRPVVPVTDDNVSVLQFLDCLKDMERCAEESPESCGRILSAYAKKNEITKSRVDELIGKFPMKIYKAIYDTGVEYVSA